MTTEEKRLSDLACDWRDKFTKQLARAVAAEERAGRKNVARLEARIAELEVENERLKNPEPKPNHSRGCLCPRC